MFTRAKNKSELADETKYIVRNSFGIDVSSALVNRVVNSRSNTIRKGFEGKAPRMLIEGLGSFRIKKGKGRFAVKKGREYYVKKANKDGLTNMGVKFATNFKIVGEDV